MQGNSFAAHALTAILSGGLAASGAYLTAKLDADSRDLATEYNRIAKLESDVQRLQQENSRQKVEIALLTAQLEYGGEINPLEVVFGLIEDIETPAWCKQWIPPTDPEAGDGVFRMAYINSDYEFQYGVSRSYYIGKTDYDVHPDELAAQYYQNDLEVLGKRRFIDFREVVRKTTGDELKRFWKFWHQPEGSDYELVCGWEVP